MELEPSEVDEDIALIRRALPSGDMVPGHPGVFGARPTALNSSWASAALGLPDAPAGPPPSTAPRKIQLGGENKQKRPTIADGGVVKTRGPTPGPSHSDVPDDRNIKSISRVVKPKLWAKKLFFPGATKRATSCLVCGDPATTITDLRRHILFEKTHGRCSYYIYDEDEIVRPLAGRNLVLQIYCMFPGTRWYTYSTPNEEHRATPPVVAWADAQALERAFYKEFPRLTAAKVESFTLEDNTSPFAGLKPHFLWWCSHMLKMRTCAFCGAQFGRPDGVVRHEKKCKKAIAAFAAFGSRDDPLSETTTMVAV